MFTVSVLISGNFFYRYQLRYLQFRHIVTAVSEIYQRSARRGLGQKKRFDPEECQKEIFAPPAH